MKMKGILWGLLSGALVFLGLEAVRAQQQVVLTVAQYHSNSKLYVGRVVEISGMAKSIRNEMRRKDGQDIPYTKLNLYEVDAKGKKGNYYVYVALPTSQFRSLPADGDMATIIGPIKWPYEIGAIDP